MADLRLYALSLLCKDHDAEAYEESKELYLEAMRQHDISRLVTTVFGSDAARDRYKMLLYQSERVFWQHGLNKICTWHDMCRFWHDHK